MICKVNENISRNTYFNSANSAVVFDWKPDRLPPKKGHLLKETSPLMPLIFHWSDRTLGILVICNLTKKYDPSLWLIH